MALGLKTTAVGTYLKSWREGEQINQSQASLRIGWAQAMYHQIESGRIRLSLEKAMELEKATNIHADKLLKLQLDEELANARHELKQKWVDKELINQPSS